VRCKEVRKELLGRGAQHKLGGYSDLSTIIIVVSRRVLVSNGKL